MKILYAILGAYLLYELQGFLYHRFWNKRLQVNLSLSRNHAVEGEDCILTETISNHKLLPIPILKVKFMTSNQLRFYDMSNANITDHYYRTDLLSVMMFQKITRNIPFCCSHRGYYTFDKMFLVCSDLLLESEYVSSYDLNVHLYVYPRLVDYERLRIPFQKMLGTVQSKRFINEDPFEFKGIREYQTFDTLKAINWKASAKANSLMVNVFDYTASQQIKIVLNLEAAVLKKQEDLLEESIRIAASFSAKFIEQGIPTAFYTNAPDIVTKEPVKLPAGSGMNHLRVIYEALSRIDTTNDIPAFLPLLKEELLKSNQGDYTILISTNQKEDLQLLLSSMLHDKTDFQWIIPYNRDVTTNIHYELIPHVFEWEVLDA